jgi:uncharacterized membrane protein
MKKYGWTEKGIVGVIFIPIGLIFLVVGAIVTRTEAVEPDQRLAFLISFVGVGAVLFCVGMVLLMVDILRRKRQKAAYEGGHFVMGKIAGIRTITQVNLPSGHPVVVEVHYTDPDTGTVHVYYSRYLYVNVGDMLAGEVVPVYLDRDSGVGFVDIDAVLPKIEVHRT